jgi:hypothetical protein
MSPLEFMQRLARAGAAAEAAPDQVPWGVLAPNAKLRALVVPQGPPAQVRAASEAAAAAEYEVETVEAGPHRISRARLLRRVVATT